MTDLFRCILIAGVLIFILIILSLMKKERLILKYALIWLGAGVVMLICAIFPGVVEIVTDALGIYSVVNAVFFVGVCFLLMIIMFLTSVVSLQTNRIRNLTEGQAMLERRVRDLEAAAKENENV